MRVCGGKIDCHSSNKLAYTEGVRDKAMQRGVLDARAVDPIRH